MKLFSLFEKFLRFNLSHIIDSQLFAKKKKQEKKSKNFVDSVFLILHRLDF